MAGARVGTVFYPPIAPFARIQVASHARVAPAPRTGGIPNPELKEAPEGRAHLRYPQRMAYRSTSRQMLTPCLPEALPRVQKLDNLLK